MGSAGPDIEGRRTHDDIQEGLPGRGLPRGRRPEPSPARSACPGARRRGEGGLMGPAGRLPGLGQRGARLDTKSERVRLDIRSRRWRGIVVAAETRSSSPSEASHRKRVGIFEHRDQ